MTLDHLALPVTDVDRSRRWSVATLGLTVEFEVPDRRTVDATFAEWSARGVESSHAPRKSYWGYGAELKDPDGYLVRLWDERSMKEK
jgi:catechol 2,3-dioxygenase-like lactoylglutathione lyase family enzyme